MKASLIKILGDLSCFSTTCLTNNDENVVIIACLDELLLVLENRKTLFLLFYGQVTRFKVFSWL